MNWTLFKATLKANWLIALFFTLFIMIYVTTSVSMFDPESAEALSSMMKMLPEGLVKALGFQNMGTDLTGFMSNYLYGFIFLTFPMIYCAIMANRLIAKHVDSGSMAYLLTTPNSRIRIAATQGLYLAVSVLAIMVVNVGLAILMSESMFPGHLLVGKFLLLNWVTYLAMLVISGISFFASCYFNETRFSLIFGAGIPVLFLVFRMVSEVSEDISWLRYLTVYTFINIEEILANPSYAFPVTLILAAVSAVLYVAGVTVFNRKSLAI